MKMSTFNKKDFRLIGFVSITVFLIIGVCQLYFFSINRRRQQLVSQPLTTATTTFRTAISGYDEILFYERIGDSNRPMGSKMPPAWYPSFKVLRGQDAKEFVLTLHFDNLIPSGWIMNIDDPRGREWVKQNSNGFFMTPGLFFRKDQRVVAALNIWKSHVRWYGADGKWKGEGQLSEQSSAYVSTLLKDAGGG